MSTNNLDDAPLISYPGPSGPEYGRAPVARMVASGSHGIQDRHGRLTMTIWYCRWHEARSGRSCAHGTEAEAFGCPGTRMNQGG